MCPAVKQGMKNICIFMVSGIFNEREGPDAIFKVENFLEEIFKITKKHFTNTKHTF